MLKLHVVQAEYGDCLLLQFGTVARPRFVLIDGGPAAVFEQHLKGALQQVARDNPVELAVLSHVDTDHIVGLLDYFAELRAQNGAGPLPAVQGLWHNSFEASLDPGGEIQTRLQSLFANAPAAIMTQAGMAINGIAEGHNLRLAAQALQIPMNAGFDAGQILVESSPEPIELGNLKIRIAGPTRANLDELRAQWLRWLEKHEAAVDSGDPFIMANSDRSVPNLSSIMFLAEADGKTILFTGDGRSDHLLKGLAQAGLLDQQGKLHVNVLKLPHHGSNRNLTRSFFNTVTADTYVGSANGRDGNPDLATLIWLVEAARAQQRRVTLVLTNRTPSVEKLEEEYPASAYPYRLQIPGASAHYKTITLSRAI